MSLGTEVQLSSHNYPSYYPSYAYVLWTFRYSDLPTSDIRYQFDFGYVYLGSSDTLKVGSGWNPDNSSTTFARFYGYYSGYPTNLLIPVGNVHVEFDANSYSERQGFQIQISVRNISGIYIMLRHC